MSEKAEDSLRKAAHVSLLFAAGACVVFWLLRVWHAISFVTPYMMVTTGGEEVAFFPIWMFTQHHAVYVDPHRIPYTYSCYNWLFYYLYGWITRTSLNLLHLDAIWIPTVGRLISIAFTLLTGGVIYLTLWDFVKTGFFANKPARMAWTLIAALSPVVGFLSLSVRPDIGALACEAAGLYLVLRYLRRQRVRWVVFAALLFYSAWAFKQTSVTMLTGSALTLLLLRRWRAFATLSGIWWSMAIVTLIAGGANYRESVLFSQQHLPFFVHMAYGNAWIAGQRNPFLLPCFAAILFLAWQGFRLLRSRQIGPGPIESRPAESELAESTLAQAGQIELAVTVTVLFSFCFTLITSSKLGASSYYYMPAAWATMLGVALKWEQINARLAMVCLIACSALLIGGIVRGHTFYGDDYRYTDSVHRAVAEKLNHLPGPAFVMEDYSNLPWVQRFPPNFILGFEYEADRSAGVSCEGGGWEVLASNGYFGTLVSYQDDTFSAALLQKYQLADEYKDANFDYKFYRRVGAGNQ
jgi:hypothetical protein